MCSFLSARSAERLPCARRGDRRYSTSFRIAGLDASRLLQDRPDACGIASRAPSARKIERELCEVRVPVEGVPPEIERGAQLAAAGEEHAKISGDHRKPSMSNRNVRPRVFEPTKYSSSCAPCRTGEARSYESRACEPSWKTALSAARISGASSGSTAASRADG